MPSSSALCRVGLKLGFGSRPNSSLIRASRQEPKGSKEVMLKREANQRGQAVLEYILLLAVTVSLVVGFSKTILTAVDQGILKFGGRLEKTLKTGRAPANVWTN